MTLKLGFSSCPNDTFIFDAMVHHKIDTEGLDFELLIADVEELNRVALQNEIDITKLSFHAYAYTFKNYQILDSGSALGRNNGPLLISKNEISPDQIAKIKKVAIPGKYTTANLLLQIAFPKIKYKEEIFFADIESAVLDGKVDAGLIIHENRFTYEAKGLKKIIDLGEFWESLTKMPIPLGCITVSRKLDEATRLKINRIMKRSVHYAFEHAEESRQFVKQYAQSLNDAVINSHIALYVNQFTLNLGANGKKAIEVLFTEAHKRGVIPEIPQNIFLSK
jgi:1,4-dihydroxy-6-naphthoate synthase